MEQLYVTILLLTVAVWQASISPSAAQGSDPVSILKASFDAANAGNVEAAVAVFADDAVIVNTRGFKFSGKEAIRRFIQANINGKVQAHVESLNPEVHGDTVMLTDRYTTAFFEQWGVAGYVDFKTDVVVRGGKIRSQINYITLDGLLKIQRACDSLQARGASDLWKACADFLAPARTQTNSMLGPAAQAGWCPRIAGLKPSTAETRFMSPPGYVRYLVHLLTGQWPKCVETPN